MNQEKIGKFIAHCRKNKNMTQQELSEKLGVSDRTIGNWENGRNMPDLSLFKPLCELLNISINDLISGERVSEDKYQEKLEENIISAIDYTNKKVSQKNSIIGIILIAFGIMLAITAMSIFPSESSWGSIYSVFGAIVSLIGVSKFTNKFNLLKRVLINFCYFIIFIVMLIIIDYIGVVNLKQVPRFSISKIPSETIIYYDTPFYDVVRCNGDSKDEYYKIINNQKYDVDNIDKFENICK